MHVEDLNGGAGVGTLAENCAGHLGVAVGDPGEVVHVLGSVCDGQRAVRPLMPLARHPGRLDHILSRCLEGDLEGAEVGEELGGAVEGVDFPSGVREHRRFRKPLHDVEVVPPAPHAIKGPRQEGLPRHLDARRISRRHRPGKRHGHHRVVDRGSRRQVRAVRQPYRTIVESDPAEVTDGGKPAVLAAVVDQPFETIMMQP